MLNTIDTQPVSEAPMYREQSGTEVQGTRQARHVEVFDHMRNRLDEVLRSLEALAGEIAKEPAKDSVPESDTPMPALSLQDFIQNAASDKVDCFANQAMNQITVIREMLF